MANWFQKILFNLSTVSPITTFAVIVWWIQYGMNEITTEVGAFHLTSLSIILSIVGLVGLLFSFYSVVLIKTCKRKLEVVPIRVNSVQSDDKWSFAAVVTYILPFSNLFLSDYNILFPGIAVVTLLFLVLINTVYPNPILLLCKFHFYKISNTNGGGEFTLISKRKSIKDSETIKKVITIWDYFMIEVV